MFQTLEEQIDRTDGDRPTTKKRMVRFTGIVIASMLLFGGLYFVIVALE